MWIADQRFWAVVIEFQPSGFSQGTYLNVGAHWFWHAKDYWSFDFGGRIEGFTRFKNADQFAIVLERLAARAADELAQLRQKFRSLQSIANHSVHIVDREGWPVYHAAVAMGLAGDITTSRQMFARLLQRKDTANGSHSYDSPPNRFPLNLGIQASFVPQFSTAIARSRTLHRLQPDAGCLDEA